MKKLIVWMFYANAIFFNSCAYRTYKVKSIDQYEIRATVINLRGFLSNKTVISTWDFPDSLTSSDLIELKVNDVLKLKLKNLPKTENPFYLFLSKFSDRSTFWIDNKDVYIDGKNYYKSSCIVKNFFIKKCTSKR